MSKLTIGLATCLLLGGTAMLAASDAGTIHPGDPAATVASGLNVLTSLIPNSNAFAVSDLDELVKIDDRFYQIEFSDEVSQEVIGSHVIKKVGHGNTSFVNVVQTPTGTYSTDGLVSKHVQYNGITVREVHRVNFDLPLAYAWARNSGWVGLPKNGSGAVMHIKSDSTSVLLTPDVSISCVRGSGFVTCI